MAAVDFNIRISPQEAVRLLDQGIVEGSFSGERLDYYVPYHQGELLCVVVVYEKFYYRAGNRLMLTVTIDNLSGVTHVHSIGGGGGDGAFWRFDWGASQKFTEAAWDILGAYAVR